jgi:hypothetical protein
MVLDALRSNNQHIKTAQLKVREVLEDAAAEKPRAIVSKLPDGGESRVLLAPRMEWEVEILLRGDDVRTDRRPLGPKLGEGEETLACFQGTWTQYTPQHAAAWILRRTDLPGMFPIDPRQVGSADIQRSLEDILREDRVSSARLITFSEGESVVEVEVTSRSGTTTMYEFGEKANFLPTRLMTRWPDGSILQLVDFEYQDVLDGQAKLVKKVSRSFFAQGATLKAANTGWWQRLTREVVGDVIVNKSLTDNQFQVTFRPGTAVHDNTKPAIYTASLVLPQNAPARWPYTALLLAVLVVLLSLRTYRHRLGI